MLKSILAAISELSATAIGFICTSSDDDLKDWDEGEDAKFVDNILESREIEADEDEGDLIVSSTSASSQSSPSPDKDLIALTSWAGGSIVIISFDCLTVSSAPLTTLGLSKNFLLMFSAVNWSR